MPPRKKAEGTKRPTRQSKPSETDQVTLSSGDLASIVKEAATAAASAAVQAVQGAAPQAAPAAQAPSLAEGHEWKINVADLKPGSAVPPGWVPPEGWERCMLDNGTFQAWPTAPKWARPGIRREVLRKVDDDYAACQPTKEFPNRPEPARLEVNERWRDLFPNVDTWGDTTKVREKGDDHFPGDRFEPQFRFVAEDGTILPITTHVQYVQHSQGQDTPEVAGPVDAPSMEELERISKQAEMAKFQEQAAQKLHDDEPIRV